MDELEQQSELVRRSQRGDPAAFDQLMRASARRVYTWLALNLRERDRADDLTQETFLRAWRTIPQLREPAAFGSWLMNIARNALLDDQKNAGRQKRSALQKSDQPVDALADANAPPGEQMERDEQRARLIALLDELPESYREVLALRYLGGADYSTIARQLQLSDGALRGLLNRGLKLLRKKLSRQEVPS